MKEKRDKTEALEREQEQKEMMMMKMIMMMKKKRKIKNPLKRERTEQEGIIYQNNFDNSSIEMSKAQVYQDSE